jgi:hypothetical protein
VRNSSTSRAVVWLLAGGFSFRARRSRSGCRVRRYVKVNGPRYLWLLTFQANRNDVGVADRAFWEFSRWLGT